jgi:hypothetical protein
MKMVKITLEIDVLKIIISCSLARFNPKVTRQLTFYYNVCFL